MRELMAVPILRRIAGAADGIPRWIIAVAVLCLVAAGMVAVVEVANAPRLPGALHTGSLDEEPLSGPENRAWLNEQQRLQIVRNMRDAIERRDRAHRESGSDSELLSVYFDYPSRLHLGDEATLILNVRCRNCADQELVISLSAPGLRMTATEVRLPLSGEVFHQRRVVLAPLNAGTKAVLVSARSLPSGRELTPEVAYISVTPAISVIGISESYLAILNGVFALISLPTAAALLLALWRRPDRPKPAQFE